MLGADALSRRIYNRVVCCLNVSIEVSYFCAYWVLVLICVVFPVGAFWTGVSEVMVAVSC